MTLSNSTDILIHWLFIEAAGENKDLLFIRSINGIPHLCTIEHNQIVNQPITDEQMKYFKEWSIGQAPLRKYTKSYLQWMRFFNQPKFIEDWRNT